MRINNNLMAMNTHRQLGLNANAGAKSIEKLSSGYRINRAGDDAAGLSISEKMRAQIRGLSQSSRNAQDGISLIQTAEGALSETHAILQRMRELADQSANGTNTADDRAAIQNEITQLRDEVDRIGNTTEFNTQKLLNGSLKSAGGAVTDQNATTGSIVAKQTGAFSTGAAALATVAAHENIAGSAASEGAGWKDEILTIDGTDITIQWGNLTSTEKATIKNATGDSTQQNSAVDMIVSKINEAIADNGANIEDVSGYVDTNGKLVLQSGSKGTTSSITFNTADAVVGTLVAATAAGSANSAAVASAQATVTSGTSVYNGSNVNVNTDFQFKIGDTQLVASNAGAINTGTAMATAATTLQTALNASITAYNTNVLGGATAGDDGFIAAVKVEATDDGRFQVTSETDTVYFEDKKGSTAVEDLGLSQAQTEAAGNGGVVFQIGANRGQTMSFGIGDMRSASLGIATLDISTQTKASAALDTVDDALAKVSAQRSSLGAAQNRLEHTIKNLDTSAENLQASESRIRDVDMAKEMMSFTKSNILQQAAQSMLAQANQAPQGVLQLLR